MAAHSAATVRDGHAHRGQSVEELRALLQTLMDSTPDWMFAKDLEHRFLFVNRAFAAAQGLAPDDMVGRSDTEFWGMDQCEPNPATGRRGFHADDRRAFAGEVVHNPHSEAIVAGGPVRIFDTVKTPLKGPDGRIIGVLSYSRDVTEQRKTDQALRDSEERLRAIVDGEPECVKLLDRDGNLLDMNAAGLRMLEAESLDEVRGRCVCPLVAPKDEPAFREMIAAALQGRGAHPRVRHRGPQGPAPHARNTLRPTLGRPRAHLGQGVARRHPRHHRARGGRGGPAQQPGPAGRGAADRRHRQLAADDSTRAR